MQFNDFIERLLNAKLICILEISSIDIILALRLCCIILTAVLLFPVTIVEN